MKKVLIVLAVLAGVVVLAFGGFALFMNNGKAATEQLAIAPVNPAGLADGEYEGGYNGGRFTNQVTVTVKGGKITAIDVKKTVALERKETTQDLINDVITAQNTDVDVKSGATITSKAYLKSIEDALGSK